MCTWVCTQVVGAERMDRAPGGRGLPEEGGPPPPAPACPGPPIRPSVPTPAPDPRTSPEGPELALLPGDSGGHRGFWGGTSGVPILL